MSEKLRKTIFHMISYEFPLISYNFLWCSYDLLHFPREAHTRSSYLNMPITHTLHWLVLALEAFRRLTDEALPDLAAPRWVARCWQPRPVLVHQLQARVRLLRNAESENGERDRGESEKQKRKKTEREERRKASEEWKGERGQSREERASRRKGRGDSTGEKGERRERTGTGHRGV